MKIHRIHIAVCWGCIVFHFVNMATAVEVTPFADPNFENAVRGELGIPAPTAITDTDMLGLNNLAANNQGITDITGIGYAVNLQTLSLNFNLLSSLPAEIGNLNQLTEIGLGGNQLASLPAEIGNLSHLTTLNLASNQLTSLPAEIGNLASLTNLILSYNQLTSLPAEIGNLTSLTRLNLADNQLSSVPEEIGNLTSLGWLSLESNHLTILPEETGKLANLTKLYLSYNQFHTLPVEIAELTQLTTLYLWKNPGEESFLPDVYCEIIPSILNNNPDIKIWYDPNPNPLTEDCSTDLSDLTDFSVQWLETGCEESNNWCGGADLNHSGEVDLEDVAIFVHYWLAELEP